METSVFSSVLLLALSGIALGQTGFKTRITSRGLNYANDVALDLLTRSITNIQVPDHSDSAGPIHFTFRDLKINRFTRPESEIAITPGQGLHWDINNTDIRLNGDWEYELQIFFFTIRDRGSFNVSVEGLSFSIGLTIGIDETGRPEITAKQCQIDIRSISIDLQGGQSWIYNYFRGALEHTVRSALISRLCNVVRDLIDVDGGNALSELQVTVPLVDKLVLDYRMDQPPNFDRTFMETFHRGEIFWNSTGSSLPFLPKPLPPWNGTEHMVYLWASDYMMNSLLYHAQEHNFLRFNLTAQSLPSSKRSALNTKCGRTSMCIGHLIPRLDRAYPNCQVDLHMKTTSIPQITVRGDAVNGSIEGVIEFYARPVAESPPINPKENNLSYLFSLAATMTATVNVEMRDDTIYGNLQDVDFDVKMLNTTINFINNRALQYIVDVALRAFVKPAINEFLAKGLAPPTIGNIHFVNPDIQLMERTLLIGVDLKYVPDSVK